MVQKRGKSKVILKKGFSRKKNILDSLKEIEKDIVKDLRKKKRIIIKPNFVSTENQLAASNVKAAESVVNFFRGITDKEIIIAESSAGDTLEGFKNFGYEKLEDKYGVSLIDLNKKGFREVKLSKDVNLRVSDIFFDKENFIVSLAIPKTHNAVVATLSLKNILMGSMLKTTERNDKGKMHSSELHINSLLDKLSRKIWPDLAVIDGYEGMEGNGPVSGNMIKHRIAIVSLSSLAADLTGLECMSINTEKVGYLSLIKKRLNPDFEVVGNINKCKKKYKLHENIEKQLNWKNKR